MSSLRSLANRFFDKVKCFTGKHELDVICIGGIPQEQIVKCNKCNYCFEIKGGCVFKK